MSKNIEVVRADDVLIDILELFTKSHISILPVVSSRGSMLLGLLTRLDFIGVFMPSSVEAIEEVRIAQEFVEDDILKIDPNLKVEDVMTKEPIVLSEEDNLLNVCALFYEHRYTALPVVDKENKLIGIVTFSDICKAILKKIKYRNMKYHAND